MVYGVHFHLPPALPPLPPAPQLPTSHAASISLPLIPHTPTAVTQTTPILHSPHQIEYYTQWGQKIKLKDCKGTKNGAKNGDIMVTQEGVKKKFNGKQWRLVCSVENCRKESRAHNCGLCVKHFSSTSNISCTVDVMPAQPLKCSMFTPMDSLDSRWKVEQDMYSTEKRHCVHSHMKWPMTCHHSTRWRQHSEEHQCMGRASDRMGGAQV